MIQSGLRAFLPVSKNELQEQDQQNRVQNIAMLPVRLALMEHEVSLYLSIRLMTPLPLWYLSEIV